MGRRIAALVQDGQPEQAYVLLAPVLARRTPYRLLGRIGKVVGAGPLPATNAFLERIAAERTEGGWVVIGSALGQQLERDLEGAFARCQENVIAADVWYGTDILGERVPGPALVAHQGDLVQVTLTNVDVPDGVTLHWHGVDVPNAEDGVAGVTQDAVRPGARWVYRFVAPEAGTYWYHSHQVSDPQVKGGLFGTFVVLPRERAGNNKTCFF